MTEKKCSKCGKVFGCCNDKGGCWCENYTIDTSILKELKNNYKDCLCEDCLKEYSDTAMSGQQTIS